MSNLTNLENHNNLIADINVKVSNMIYTVQNLPNFLDTSDANAIAEDILEDKTAYVNGIKIIGNRSNKFIVQDGMKFGFSANLVNSGENWDVSNVTDMGSMFSYCSNITSLNTENWDVSNVTNMASMFYGCRDIISLNITNWDVSNVTNMASMFSSCNNISNLDVSNWDVSNVTNFISMFSSCSNLNNLNVSNWNVTNRVTGLYMMFRGCSNLESLDVSNWDMSNISNVLYLFSGCVNLVNINVSNWHLYNTNENGAYFYGMFTNCNNLSDASIDSVINMCLNLQYVSSGKNLYTNFYASPFNGSNITNDRYQNRWPELTAAGWSY